MLQCKSEHHDGCVENNVYECLLEQALQNITPEQEPELPSQVSEKIKMLKSKADMMSRSMKENCVKIEELDSEHKKQGFTIDDLQRKLNVVKKKIQRLDEFKRNESDF